MTTSDRMARKVARLDNDVEAIYEMLTVIGGTLTRQQNRLDEIAGVQEGHTATLAEHTATLAEHTATLAEHTATLAEHGTKLDRIIALLEAR